MNTANTRPFLVSSGGQQFSASTTNRHAAATLSRRRPSTSGPPQGRRTSSARNIPNPAAHQRRSRVRSDVSLASKIDTIPEAAEKRGKGVVVDAATTTSSGGRKLSAFRKKIGEVAFVNVATRRSSTAKTASAHVSRRGSTMKEILEQHNKQQQPVDPVVGNNSIQAERQQRRKRGLNLRYCGRWQPVDH